MPSVLDTSSPVSPVDFPDLGTVTPMRSVSSGIESLAMGCEKSGDPQQPTRSLFSSLCIVAACTSSMVVNVALGPTIAISIPYTGKDLNIQKNNLQWIVNAYSISSVGIPSDSVSCSLAHLRHRHASFFFAGGLQIFTAANLSGLLAI